MAVSGVESELAGVLAP
jgi:hypothetical protein